MGTIKLWIDILSPAQAHDYPPIDISLPSPVDMELRVVVWKARNVPSFDTMEDMNDLFFRCWMEGSDYQETDIHWRAKKGKGSFNWRMKFPITLGHKQINTKMPYFHVQGWDKDVLSANDAIGVATVDLGAFFRQAYKLKTNVQCYEDDDETRKKKKKATSDDDAAVKKIREATGLWDDDDPADSKWLQLLRHDHKTNEKERMGEVCISLELVPAENAKKNPVGMGRSSPNTRRTCLLLGAFRSRSTRSRCSTTCSALPSATGSRAASAASCSWWSSTSWHRSSTWRLSR